MMSVLACVRRAWLRIRFVMVDEGTRHKWG
jgi:hypothetical protein